MSRVTFKQFNAFMDAPLAEEEQLDEIFGIFKSKEEKEKAERQKLELLAKKGNLQAQLKLRQLQKDDERRSAAAKAQDTAKERSFQLKKAEVEAGERGSSRAFDKEAGSAGAKMAPRWNAARGEWEKYDPVRKAWAGTGDRDKWSGEPEKRGTR